MPPGLKSDKIILLNSPGILRRFREHVLGYYYTIEVDILPLINLSTAFRYPVPIRQHNMPTIMFGSARCLLLCMWSVACCPPPYQGRWNYTLRPSLCVCASGVSDIRSQMFLRFKGPVSHALARVQRTKNEQFCSHLLGGRQFLFMICRKRWMNTIFIYCVCQPRRTFIACPKISAWMKKNARPAPSYNVCHR